MANLSNANDRKLKGGEKKEKDINEKNPIEQEKMGLLGSGHGFLGLSVKDTRTITKAGLILVLLYFVFSFYSTNWIISVILIIILIMLLKAG